MAKARKAETKLPHLLGQDVWKLTVSHWHRAVEAGVPPVLSQPFRDVEEPGRYVPMEFLFLFPPTREDFLALRRKTPWLQGAYEELFCLIAKNDWPIVAVGYKAESVELMLDDVAHGRLDVRRYDMAINDRYTVNGVATHELAAATKGMPRDKQDKAIIYLESRATWAIETFVRQKSNPADRLAILKYLLYEGGFRVSPPKGYAKIEKKRSESSKSDPSSL